MVGYQGLKKNRKKDPRQSGGKVSRKLTRLGKGSSGGGRGRLWGVRAVGKRKGEGQGRKEEGGTVQLERGGKGQNKHRSRVREKEIG